MKVLICDEMRERALENKAFLTGCAERNHVDATIDVVESGEKLLFYKDTKYAKVDLIYINYNLTKTNGMEVARALRRGGYLGDIVFWTTDTAHAREGYDVDALAYLLIGKETKATRERIFMKAVGRCQKRGSEVISFSHRGEQRNIPIEDIVYFEVLDHTVTVHYYKNQNQETFDFYSSLSKIEKELANKGFLRTHKSYLVAQDHIYKKMPDYLEMSNGDQLPIGDKFEIDTNN
jgi:DNA-binding LytR/AlgR family response regulator